MDIEIARKIFRDNNLGDIKTFEKIEIGFTNEVYSVDDKFIIKVCEKEKNESRFKQEALLYKYFEDTLPVPNILKYDGSKSIYNKIFTIYPKIQGDNLYSKWHLLSDQQREDCIKQLCRLLKIIHTSDLEKISKLTGESYKISWKAKMGNSIAKSLKEISTKSVLKDDFIECIEDYVNQNIDTLDQQNIALVYWDAHFDNILVKDNVIVGILDFEGVEFSSDDFALDVIKRMSDLPSKYMSEEFEKYAKAEDYSNLLHWFKKYYPELFQYHDMPTRLNLYSIEHDLKDIIGWPNALQPKQTIAKVVGYSE